MIILLQTGFKLEENITVHGISSEALKITCQEAICWGNSFRSLSRLIMPDPQTGKLQQDGLIFKVHTILSHHNARCSFFLITCDTIIGNVRQYQRTAPLLSLGVAKDS